MVVAVVVAAHAAVGAGHDSILYSSLFLRIRLVWNLRYEMQVL